MGERNNGIGPVPKEASIELLGKVCSVLNEYEIEYFLTCGTLLGYIRERDFIAWDSDIDLGVFEISAFEDIIPNLQSKNLNVRRVCPEHGLRMSLSYQITDSESKLDYPPHLDIFEFERTSQGIIFRMVNTRRIFEMTKWFLLTYLSRNEDEDAISYHSVDEVIRETGLPGRWLDRISQVKKWARRNLFLRQYLHIFDPFMPEEVSWFDYMIKIPSNPEDHLRLLYGENWRIPNRDYAQSLERQQNIWRVRL